MPTKSCISTSGEDIEIADYDRWLAQAAEAYHALDENFNDGDGAEGEDQQDQLSDLLTQLRHLAQAVGLDYDDAARRAQTNYAAEKRRTAPQWAKDLLK